MQRCQDDIGFVLAGLSVLPTALGSERKTVNEALLRVVLTSASLPRNPMRVTRLLIHDSFLLFCSRILSGHTPEGARRAAPKARAAFSGRGPKLVLGEESGKSRSPQSAGRSYSAEAVPEGRRSERRETNLRNRTNGNCAMDRDRSLNGPSTLNLLSLSKAAELAGTTRFQLSDFLNRAEYPLATRLKRNSPKT